jgi:murein DD-endopeptidase MepM/ murein hydrolase activator NlpD
VVGLALALTMTGCSAEPVGDPDAPPAVLSPELRDIVLTPDTTLVSGLVPRSTTLDTLLRGHGVADDAAVAVVNAARTVFDPRRLRALQPFSIERTVEGTLRFFEYEIDNDRFLRVAPSAAGSAVLAAMVVPIPKTLEHLTAAGRIDAGTPSLFQSMAGAGEGAELAVSLAQIFSGEIDFDSDLQPGDGYALAFDKYTREGGQSSYGDISAAEFRNDGRVLRAIRFTVPGGKAAYYDERGRSLRRFFLRSPLKFEPRVTSRFSVEPDAPGAAHRAGASGAWITRADRRAGDRGCGRRRGVGELRRRQRPHGPRAARLGLRDVLSPPLRLWPRYSHGRPRRSRTDGRVGGCHGAATGPICTTGSRATACSSNPLREHMNQPPGEPVPASAMAAFKAERDRDPGAVAGK